MAYCNCGGQYRNVIRMKGLHKMANADPEKPLTFAPFFLGPQHAKGPWDSAGATFKSVLNKVSLTYLKYQHVLYVKDA